MLFSSLPLILFSHRPVHSRDRFGFWLPAWPLGLWWVTTSTVVFGNANRKGAWVVFGLLRVVGSLLVQTTSTWHTSSVDCLGVFRLSMLWVSCVAYLSYGILLGWSKLLSSCVTNVASDEPWSCLFAPHRECLHWCCGTLSVACYLGYGTWCWHGVLWDLISAFV